MMTNFAIISIKFAETLSVFVCGRMRVCPSLITCLVISKNTISVCVCAIVAVHAY